MARIKVNHSELTKTANEMDNFLSRTKDRMNSASGSVDRMIQGWEGADYTQFDKQWTKVTASDSTYRQMVKSLDAYADYLRFAADKYKDAQAKAVNRANRLPRW